MLDKDQRVDNDSELSRSRPIKPASLPVMRKIVIACVVIEFTAIMAVIVGASPVVFWIAIAVATIGAIVAFIVGWKTFHPLVGLALAGLNALSCYRLWFVPYLIADGGVDKYLLPTIVMVRVIGWIPLAIINQRAKIVCNG